MVRTPQENPLERGAKPPFPRAEPQEPPGSEAKMEPRPDYGLETYKGTGKLKGKKALITGGDSGIGRAVTLAFAREGADIALSYLNEDEDAREIEEVVEKEGRRVLNLPGDIADFKHCRSLVERTIDDLGGIDILVNNAAYQRVYGDISEIPPEDIEYTFRVNIFSMFHLCQAALPHMKKGSSVINVASIQAYKPSPELLPYAATKGAIVTFTKGLAEQVIDKGIRANVVAPGPVWTPLVVSTMRREKTENFGKNYPIERPAQPAELAPLFVFLASSDSTYITGEVVGVTGGKLLP